MELRPPRPGLIDCRRASTPRRDNLTVALLTVGITEHPWGSSRFEETVVEPSWTVSGFLTSDAPGDNVEQTKVAQFGEAPFRALWRSASKRLAAGGQRNLVLLQQQVVMDRSPEAMPFQTPKLQ